MTSKIIVNNIESDTGVSTITISSPVNLSGGTTGGVTVGTGASITSPATNVLTMSTNDTERIRVGAAGSIGIGTDNPIQTLDVRGETTFGEGITKADLEWGTDTYQRVYSFSGASGGATTSPADAAILLANPNTNPSNTRVGSIVFGNKVVGTANTSTNPGIKATIDGRTNTNISTNADDTGGHININTKPDGGDLRTVATFNSEGHFLQNYQPRFEAYNGPADVTGAVLVFGSTSFNTGGHYSTTTGRFTAPVAGHYWFFANPYRYSTLDDGIIYLRVNASNRVESRKWTAGATGWLTFDSGMTVYLNVDDYVDVYGSTRTHCNTNLSRFSGFLIG